MSQVFIGFCLCLIFFVCPSLKVARRVVYVTAYISWEVWVHKTSLTRPHFIEVLVPSQESETIDYSSVSATFFYWMLEFFL